MASKAKRTYVVTYKGREARVVARTMGAAVHKALKGWREVRPRTDRNGWFTGVTCQLVLPRKVYPGGLSAKMVTEDGRVI